MQEGVYLSDRGDDVDCRIRVKGMAVGTLCVLDRKERNDIDINKLEAMGERVAELLKQRAARKQSALGLDPISEEAGVAHGSGSVMEINAATAAQHLASPKSRIAVLLHTSMCGGCHALFPHWQQLAAKGASYSGGAITFATYNLNSGDPPLQDPVWKVDAVPAVILVSGVDEKGRVARLFPGTPAPATISYMEDWVRFLGMPFRGWFHFP